MRRVVLRREEVRLPEVPACREEEAVSAIELTYEQDDRGIVRGKVLVGGFRTVGSYEREEGR